MSSQNNSVNHTGGQSSVIINNRSVISLTGIDEVVSFDTETVILIGCGDTMTIDGQDLNITKLSLDSGEVVIEGRIDGLFYTQAKQQRRGIFSGFGRS